MVRLLTCSALPSRIAAPGWHRAHSAGCHRHCIASSSAPFQTCYSVVRPDHLSLWKKASDRVGAALLTSMLICSIGVLPVDALQRPASADEEEMLPAERRQLAIERKRERMAKAREIAIKNGGEISEDAPSLFTGIEPEQQQIPTQTTDPSSNVSQLQTPDLPKLPTPDLPKSSMPELPRFSLPKKAPVEPPPGPSMNIPQNVPKTESPAIPVPAPPGNSQSIEAPSPGFSFGNWFQDVKGNEATEPAKQAAPVKQREATAPKEAEKPVDKRLARRHGPPLFLVQLLLTIGLLAAVVGFVVRYDAVMAAGGKVEKFITGGAEKLENKSKAVPDVGTHNSG